MHRTSAEPCHRVRWDGGDRPLCRSAAVPWARTELTRHEAGTERENRMEAPHEITLTRPSDDTLLVRLSGSWKLGLGLASTDTVRQQFDDEPTIARIAFDCADIVDWDSALLGEDPN